MTDPDYPDGLPAQSRLHWYVIERVLGQGGFGITYLARDTNLDQRVAIKEYLPVEFATRMPDATIRSRTEGLRDRYRWGLERFIQEARTLARFDHPSIVRVLSVFEFNNTAYMVMRFEEGTNLAALLDRRGTLPENDLLRLLLPILDGLEGVHRAGFIHRDIKPDNIHIGDDGRAVLLDFGSARQSLGNANSLTILVAPGYAPFEQYYSDSGNQGPWTDIYGLGATCYRAIAGRSPLDAVSRSKGILGSTQEVLVPATVIGAGRYSGRLLAAIDHALEFSEKDRPQSVTEWREELTGDASVPTPMPTVAAPLPAGVATTTHIRTPTRSDVAVASLAGTVEPAASAVIAPSPDALTPPALRSKAIAMAVSVAIVAAAVAAYVVYMDRGDEARSRILKLERAERQRQDDEAHQAQAAQEKSRAEAAAKRDVAEPSVTLRAPDPPRLAEKKNVEESKRPAPQPAPSVPVTVPPAPKAPAPPVVASQAATTSSMPSPVQTAVAPAQTVASSQMAAPSLPPVVAAVSTESAKPAAARTPTEQLADADRATEAKRFSEALAIIRPLADAGNAHAQTRMGDAYMEGRGVPRDDAAAGRWYEDAALKGETGAQVKLATMYAKGKGVLPNYNLAYIWFGTAARLGVSSAKVEQEQIASLLQPTERAQADKLIESRAARMAK